MTTRLFACVALAGLLAAADLAAQQPACSLLTSSEVEAAAGSAPGSPKESTVPIPDGPAKGEAMASCRWPIPSRQGAVTVNLVGALEGAARAAGLARIGAAMDQLMAQGSARESRQFGDVRCSAFTPPAAGGKLPVISGCMGEAKGQALSVGMMAPGKRLSFDEAKGLFDKAANRIK